MAKSTGKKNASQLRLVRSKALSSHARKNRAATTPAEPAIPRGVAVASREILPVFGVVEAEEKLSSLIGALRSAGAPKDLLHKKIGSFWSDTWPQAPFEKELTIRQLFDLNIEGILKKRSFSGQKVTAFIYALEKALSEVRGELAMPAGAIPWKDDSLTSVEQGCVSSVADACADAASHQGELASFMQKLLAVLTPVEFLALLEPGEVCAALRLKGAEKITNLFAKQCPSAINMWGVMLSGPGAHESHLIDPLLVKPLNSVPQRIVLRAVLAAMGAEPVRIRNVQVPGCWTKNPQAADSVFGAVLEGRSKDEMTCKAVFPFIPASLLPNS